MLNITKQKLNILLIVLCIFLMPGCSNKAMKSIDPVEFEQIVTKTKNSKLIILDIYHDRCESCKQIEPVMEELKNDLSENPNISFLKYDLSNPLTIYKSRKIAKELDLENLYKAQRYSGVVLFIDNNSKQVIDTLIAEYDITRYRKVIEERFKNLNS